jgi:predicted metalloprotease with PDZ domain
VLGARTEAADGGARLVHVYDGGAARAAGLTAGDLVVAVEGLRVSHATLERTLTGHAPDDPVRVHAFRRDELIERTVTLGRAPLDTCVLSLREDADDVTRRAREAWLRGGTAPG